MRCAPERAMPRPIAKNSQLALWSGRASSTTSDATSAARAAEVRPASCITSPRVARPWSAGTPARGKSTTLVSRATMSIDTTPTSGPGQGVAPQSIGEQVEAVLAPGDEVAAAQRRNAPEVVERELGGVGLGGLGGLGVAERRARVVPRQAGALDDVTQIDVLGDVAGLAPDAAHRRARERHELAVLRRPVRDRETVIDAGAERDTEPIGLALGVAHDVEALDAGYGQPAGHHRRDRLEDERDVVRREDVL